MIDIPSKLFEKKEDSIKENKNIITRKKGYLYTKQSKININKGFCKESKERRQSVKARMRKVILETGKASSFW